MANALLTSELSAVRDAAKEFAQTSLASHPADWEAWQSQWQDLARAGFLGLRNDENLGGAGQDVKTTIAQFDGLGQGAAGLGTLMQLCAQTFAIQETLRAFCSDDQKAVYLPDLGRGAKIGAYALSETDTGSDALALKTTARKVDDGYVLNGSKAFVGMGPVADVVLVFASTRPEDKQWGLSVFLVEAGDDGFIRHEADQTICHASTPLGRLSFEDCKIPANRLLASEGAGQSIFQHSMIWERGFILASHVGAMRRQVQDTKNFAQDRVLFGKPILANQSVSNRIADMALRAQTAELMLYNAAYLADEGKLTSDHAALVKLQISEAFLASSLDALRVTGGRGLTLGHSAETDLRDGLGGVIYSGTSDIQRNIIARMV